MPPPGFTRHDRRRQMLDASFQGLRACPAPYRLNPHGASRRQRCRAIRRSSAFCERPPCSHSMPHSAGYLQQLRPRGATGSTGEASAQHKVARAEDR